VTAARHRRRTTDQQLAARAVELGFPSLWAYLADRAVTQRWSPRSLVCTQPRRATRLDQHGLPRRRATVRPRRATQRQLACWAATRQARLTALGFADLEG
jgi:hypothetical protein